LRDNLGVLSIIYLCIPFDRFCVHCETELIVCRYKNHQLRAASFSPQSSENNPTQRSTRSGGHSQICSRRCSQAKTLQEKEEARQKERKAWQKAEDEAAAKRAEIAVDMKTSVAYGTDTGDYVMSQLESDEVDKILHLWSRDMAGSGWDIFDNGWHITKIERIYNPYLEGKYEATRQHFLRDNIDVTEEFTFHGTVAPFYVDR
jgi:hypothetical protein